MQYEIDTSSPLILNWNAKNEERIIQNIKNLISTFRYEIGYDRTKGLDPTILHLNSDEAMALYTSEIYRLIETYEPRAKVVTVTPTKITPFGNLEAKVVIEIYD